MNYFINDSVSFFLVNGDEYKYLATVCLHKFFIDKEKSARLLLSVYYNEVPLFDEFDTIELRRIEFDDRSNPQNGELFALISDCEIKQKWFDELVIRSVEQQELVSLYMYIKCNIYFINWDLYNEHKNR